MDVRLCVVKAKFHYAIQSQTRSPPGRRPASACRRPVESHVEIARTCLRPAFDLKTVASWSQTRTNLSETWSETGSATRSAIA